MIDRHKILILTCNFLDRMISFFLLLISWVPKTYFGFAQWSEYQTFVIEWSLRKEPLISVGQMGVRKAVLPPLSLRPEAGWSESPPWLYHLTMQPWVNCVNSSSTFPSDETEWNFSKIYISINAMREITYSKVTDSVEDAIGKRDQSQWLSSEQTAWGPSHLPCRRAESSKHTRTGLSTPLCPLTLSGFHPSPC